MGSGARVEIDLNRCVGSTMCVQFAGSVFALDDSGQSTVADADGATVAEIIDAASQCPMEAIAVHDATTGVTLFPA